MNAYEVLHALDTLPSRVDNAEPLSAEDAVLLEKMMRKVAQPIPSEE